MSDAQQQGHIVIATPLGEDVFRVCSFSCEEGISRLFRIQLEMLSEDQGVSFEALVGKNVTVHVLLADGTPRFWNGYISSFSQGGRHENLTFYYAEVVPWFWFLTRTTDCRIFQDKKTPDIIRQIFSEAGFSDFALRLYGDFADREYCVQYRETDFEFISRLMEDEGICYFFEHENGKHTLVLANSPEAHKPCPNQPRAAYEYAVGGRHEEDAVLEWRLGQDLVPGSYALQDYSFEAPSTDLGTNISGRNPWELYEYPGKYSRRSEGEALVRRRLQETETPRLLARGSSDCRAFVSGHRFDLTDHYRGDHNQSYLLTSVSHTATQKSVFRSGDPASADFVYSNTFECIPSRTQFRPPRLTPRPIIQGSQTAVVVGKDGEEIWTDKYGRVKVQFHWDRYGKKNENSSCWVRVSQSSAGKGWGAISLPRIGQEVVVSFLEGDPDHPLITGRVYNAEQVTPYNLPAEQTKSTLKTNSSKGGEGFNEIRFEDAKGKEQIFIHAERNQDIRVKKDLYCTVGGEAHEVIQADHLLSVTGDEHIHVKGEQNQKVDGGISLESGTDLQQKAALKYALEAGSEVHLKSGLNLVVESGTTLTLKVGGSFVNLNPGGVFISGPVVMINSGGSAGSGSGASPQAPKQAKEADKAVPGKKATVKRVPPPKQATFSPAATVLKQAAQSGVPFCEVCSRK